MKQRRPVPPNHPDLIVPASVHRWIIEAGGRLSNAAAATPDKALAQTLRRIVRELSPAVERARRLEQHATAELDQLGLGV